MIQEIVVMVSADPTLLKPLALLNICGCSSKTDKKKVHHSTTFLQAEQISLENNIGTYDVDQTRK